MSEDRKHAGPNRKRGSRRRSPSSEASAPRDEETLPGGSASGETIGTSEHQLRLLFEQNLAGVYQTTLTGTILNCNESMAAMLRYNSRQELLGHRAQELYFTSADRDKFLARLRKTGVLTNDEGRLRCKDGTAIHILENVSLVPDESGELSRIQGTMVDITELKRAQSALQESEQRHRSLANELRSLMRRLHTIREEERTRIAREIHDELGQALTVLNMDLHWLRGRSPADSVDIQDRISSMGKLLGTTIHSVHRICADLRPTILDDFGLAAAIEWQAREFEARTGIRCRISLPDVSLDPSDEQSTAVFRIFQECLTNVARHAHAERIKISLNTGSDMLVLKVSDNGVGIPDKAKASSDSFGIAGMRERALQWGGRVDITGAANEGTQVVLRMPIMKTPRESMP